MMSDKKYEILAEEGPKGGFRIRSLKNFGSGSFKVSTGDLGGYVDCYENLSHEGNCWVYDESYCGSGSLVSGDAIVSGGAEVRDNSTVTAKALIEGNKPYLNNVLVSNNSHVGGSTNLKGAMWLDNTTLSYSDSYIGLGFGDSGVLYMHNCKGILLDGVFCAEDVRNDFNSDVKKDYNLVTDVSIVGDDGSISNLLLKSAKTMIGRGIAHRFGINLVLGDLANVSVEAMFNCDMCGHTIDSIVPYVKESTPEVEQSGIVNTDDSYFGKKYKLSEETYDFRAYDGDFGKKELIGQKVHKIIALKDFGDVSAGDEGGYVSSESNLSQEGTCWIYKGASCLGTATVVDSSTVKGVNTVIALGSKVCMGSKVGYYSSCGVRVYGSTVFGCDLKGAITLSDTTLSDTTISSGVYSYFGGCVETIHSCRPDLVDITLDNCHQSNGYIVIQQSEFDMIAKYTEYPELEWVKFVGFDSSKGITLDVGTDTLLEWIKDGSDSYLGSDKFAFSKKDGNTCTFTYSGGSAVVTPTTSKGAIATTTVPTTNNGGVSLVSSIGINSDEDNTELASELSLLEWDSTMWDKYKFSGDTMSTTVDGANVTFSQIVSLIDFTLSNGTKIAKDTKGGYLESVDNLAQTGSAWVTPTGLVRKSAYVSGDAIIKGVVSGNAKVYGNAVVNPRALVTGNAEVYENAVVGDSRPGKKSAAVLKGDIKVCGTAKIQQGYTLKDKIMVVGQGDDRLPTDTR